MSNQVTNVSTMNNSNCKNTPCSAITVKTNAPKEYLEGLVCDVQPQDDLLDFKLRNLIDVLRDNLDNLHDDINNEEPRHLLLARSNNISALFEILRDLLPSNDSYFEQVNDMCCHLNGFIHSKNI